MRLGGDFSWVPGFPPILVPKKRLVMIQLKEMVTIINSQTFLELKGRVFARI